MNQIRSLLLERSYKPTDNAFVESFNGRLRDECLNAHWFLSMTDARTKIEAWRHKSYVCPLYTSRRDPEFAVGLEMYPECSLS